MQPRPLQTISRLSTSGSSSMLPTSVAAGSPKEPRAIYIPEITNIICVFLPIADNARLARTCRQISESALDELWRVVEGLERIFSLWPQDSYERATIPEMARPLI